MLFAKKWQIGLADVESEKGPVGDRSCASVVGSSVTTDTLLSGATSFTAEMNSREFVRIFPKTVSVIIFQRHLFHGGDDVFRDFKYTLRADFMYTSE